MFLAFRMLQLLKIMVTFGKELLLFARVFQMSIKCHKFAIRYENLVARSQISVAKLNNRITIFT